MAKKGAVAKQQSATMAMASGRTNNTIQIPRAKLVHSQLIRLIFKSIQLAVPHYSLVNQLPFITQTIYIRAHLIKYKMIKSTAAAESQ
jgi:hypothetical protein